MPSGGTSAPKPSKPAVTKDGKLVEDGRWGTATTKRLQKLLGVEQDGRMGPLTWKAVQRHLNKVRDSGITVDGLIENQSYKHSELGNGISPNGWQFTGRRSKGSKTIRGIQRRVGVKDVDGVLFEGTTRALQKALNSGKF